MTRSPAVDRFPALRVFVLIDALGWEVVRNFPFLEGELSVRMPLTTVLGYSSGAIPAILTGQVPSKTGRWNLLRYDPATSPFRWLKWCRGLPDRLVNNRYVRRLVREVGRRVLGLGPLFECSVSPKILPYFDWVEKGNIYTTGGIPGAISVFDRLEELQIPYRVYSYHDCSDADICLQASRDIEQRKAGFYFLYLCEVDHFLHVHRNDHTEIAARLADYETQLRKVFGAALRCDSRAELTVISDHGMTPVNNYYDLLSEIEKLGLKMPEQYLAVYDSTMARYWFFDESARVAVGSLLEHASCGRILSDQELERLGILFPDRRYGELIFLLDPGWLFARSDFNGVGWQPAGMHGYHPSDNQSDAIYLSNKTPVTNPKTILDVYRCFLNGIE